MNIQMSISRITRSIRFELSEAIYSAPFSVSSSVGVSGDCDWIPTPIVSIAFLTAFYSYEFAP